MRDGPWWCAAIEKTRDMPKDASPDVIAGRYQLGQILGRGGMGDVRAGTDLALGREVAVKFLRNDLAHQPNLRHRFEREARAAARITHPHVVAIYDIGEHEGLPYIVMERLSGRTLADEMTAGALAEARACSLVLETLAALDAAHRLGVIHRDIKPGNILLTPDGHAKVADFGIAKLAEDLEHTATGTLFGTAGYLAPERLAGRPATPASDLYSVGVVLFEALAGRPAFIGDTPLALVASISEGVPVSLTTLRSDLDPGVVAAVERAMAKDPDLRFESAPTMAAALVTASRPPASSAFDAATVPVASGPMVSVASAPPTSADGADPPATVPRMAATEILVDATAPADSARHQKTGGRANRRRAVLACLLGLVLAAAGLAALISSEGDHSPGAPSSSSTIKTSNTIPAPLQRAIDQLEHVVRP